MGSCVFSSGRIASFCWSIMYSVTPVGNICGSWRCVLSIMTVTRPSVKDLAHSALLPASALSNAGVETAGAAEEEEEAAGAASAGGPASSSH